MIGFVVLSLFAMLSGVEAVGGCNAQNAISNATFSKLIRSINAAPFSSQKQIIIQNYCSKNLTEGFAGWQVAELIDTAAFSSNRNFLVQTISPWVLGLSSADMATILSKQPFSSDKIATLTEYVNYVTDLKVNNASIIDAFTFSSDKKTAQQLIDVAKPVSCLWGDISFKKHIVFVVDVSGSMSTKMVNPEGNYVTRLDFAVSQLVTILTKSLDSTQYFNLIHFQSSIDAWQPGVVQATVGNVASAVQWAEALRAGGSTAMYKAMTLATSDPNAEGIILLSDGEPNCCKPQLLSLAQSWTANGNAINTVLLEAGGAAQTAAAKFMCSLAAAGQGVCRTNN